MTSGLTFLTVIALFLLGGPVLNGFSFALVCGIIVGTYSSVFVASPIVLFWHNYTDQRARGRPRRWLAGGRGSRKRPREESDEGGQVECSGDRCPSGNRRRGERERKLRMFEQTFVEGEERPTRPGRYWCRFVGQIVLIGVAVILPMIYFDVLPHDQLTSFLVAPPPPPPPPPPPAAAPPSRW